MKKCILFGFAAAMTLASCTTNDEVLDAAAQAPMEFSSFVNKETKAPMDLSVLKQAGFSIFGYKHKGESTNMVFDNIFNNVPLSWTESSSNTSSWTYPAPIRYWDKTCAYDFYAYAPTSVNVQISATAKGNATLSLNNFNVSNVPANYWAHTDLLIADQITDYRTYTSPVSFTFRHTLTKLSINFSTTLSANNVVVLKTATLNNVNNQGDYTLNFSTSSTPITETPITARGTWTINDNKVTFSKQVEGDIQLDANTKAAFTDLLMIPQPATGDHKKTLDLQYSINGENYTKTIALDLQEGWKSNQSITYNISISATEITFNASVEVWDTTLTGDKGTTTVGQ